MDREPLKAGKATFEIRDIDLEYVSKTSGNTMKRISLMVTDHSGNRGMIWEYYTEKMLWKWIDLLNAIDEKDSISPYLKSYNNIITKTGECIVKLEKSTNPAYPAESPRVDKYVPYNNKEAKFKAEVELCELEFNDDIPF